MISPFRIDSDDKSVAQAYREKRLESCYFRNIKNFNLMFSKEECVQKYGDGNFFHLNVHTKFTTLGGVDEPSDIFKTVKANGMIGVAITETGFMSSIPDCWQAGKDTGLKYVVGMCAHFNDFEVKHQEMIKKEVKDFGDLLPFCTRPKTPFVTILAKNAEGYKDLLKLNSASWYENYYYVPKISREMLKRFNRGNFIVLSGNLLDRFIEFGFINSSEERFGVLSAYEYLKFMDEEFGNDFYVELTMRCQNSNWGSDLDRMITVFSLLNKFKKETGRDLNTVITNDVHYIQRDDEYVYKAMVAIQRNTIVNKIRDYSKELYFKTRAELRATHDTCFYKRAMSSEVFERSCDNTLIIADKCSSFKADTSPKLPSIENAATTLKLRVAAGLKYKGLDKDTNEYEVDGKKVTYVQQAKIELDRIISKGFESYFIIMQDIIKYNNSLGFQTGPGRGSAAGSLTCYLLGITSLDPIAYGLSFDRFLSRSRGGHMLKISME